MSVKTPQAHSGLFQTAAGWMGTLVLTTIVCFVFVTHNGLEVKDLPGLMMCWWALAIWTYNLLVEIRKEVGRGS